MMNWNKNDTKYILKRLILYFLITGIVFFAGQKCAKASVVSRYQCNTQSSTSCDSTFQASDTFTTTPIYKLGNDNFFQNYGQGFINFSFIAWGYSGTYNLPIYEVDLRANSGNVLYVCDIGTYSQYYDNNNNYTVYSVKCPVQMGNWGVYDIMYKKYSGDETILIKRSEIMTFVGNEGDANAINSSAQNIAQSQMANDNANANAIMAEINRDMYGVQSRLDQYGAQQHQDSQAQTDAINSVNSSIQAQTQWQQQDYSYDSNLDDMFNFESLFQTDDDFLRRMILFPFTIFSLILNAINSNACVQYDFGELLGTHIVFPCINWKNYIGNGLYMIIDSIFALCITFGFIRYIIGLYDYIFSIGLKGGAVALSATVEAFK